MDDHSDPAACGCVVDEAGIGDRCRSGLAFSPEGSEIDGLDLSAVPILDPDLSVEHGDDVRGSDCAVDVGGDKMTDLPERFEARGERRRRGRANPSACRNRSPGFEPKELARGSRTGNMSPTISLWFADLHHGQDFRGSVGQIEYSLCDRSDGPEVDESD